MADDVTVSMERYGFAERMLNRVAAVSVRFDLPPTRLDVDDMLRAAAKAEGSDDWGDETFVRFLREAVRQLQAAGITPLAHAFVRGICVRAIRNRIKIERFFKAHPEVAEIPVERPVFIVGFPRTGTTVLQNTLSLHPARRALQFWELTAPVPEYPDPAEDERRRKASTERILFWANLVAPEQNDLHEVRADTPEECWGLFMNTFAVLNFDFQTGMTSWGDWLFEQDLTWAYEEYRRMLQILLHQRPAKHLVLKCPEHLWFLDPLLKVFPDAGIVWTHRDPYTTVGSYCSMISLPRRTYFGHFEHRDIGTYVVERFHSGIVRGLEARARASEDRFVDIAFEDVVRDTPGVVRQICERFGLEPGDDLEAQVAAWQDSGRKDKRGSHVYDPSRYGLEAEAVRARWSDYIERFDVALDDD